MNVSSNVQEALARLRAQKVAAATQTTSPKAVETPVTIETPAPTPETPAQVSTPSPSEGIISPQAFEIKEKVASLQNAILASHPTLPVLLRTIHQQLRADPELVTILDEEEIGIIVNGLKKQTNTEIATSISKKSSASNAGSIKAAAKKGGGSIADLL